MKKRIAKRLAAAMLCLCMLATMLPTGAGAVDVKTEGSDQDVFSALGIDTSQLPEGYDPDSPDNPFGRSTATLNEIYELFVGGTKGSLLQGHNGDVNAKYAGGLLASSSTSYSGWAMPYDQFYAVAAGDFNGDGLPGEMAVVGFDFTGGTEGTTFAGTGANLSMYLIDKDANKSDKIMLDDSYISPYFTQYAGAWQNLLSVATGDFDGDGKDEIAVYIPETGQARVVVYKFMADTASAADENSWRTQSGKWKVQWTHYLADEKLFGGACAPDMVSLCAGDFDRDGTDDLAISWGGMYYGSFSARVSEVNGTTTTDPTGCREADEWNVSHGQFVSEACVLYGSSNAMLSQKQDLAFGEELLRASFTFGDLDGDDVSELVYGGQPKSDYSQNTSRVIGTFILNSETGLLENGCCSTVKVIDGTLQNSKWQSNNGFDQYYYSLPYMRSNLAVVTPVLGGDTYVYIDSLLCAYNDGFTLSNDLTECVGDSDVTLKWGLNSANCGYYCEFGASAAVVASDTSRMLLSSFVNATSSSYNGIRYKYSVGGTTNGAVANTFGLSDGATTFYMGFLYGTSGEIDSTIFMSDSNTDGAFYGCFPNTDNDTVVLYYTGKHYITYTDPKVLAVLASAP